MLRKQRENKGSWSDQNHDILAGKASILRVRNSGDVWQFRMWVGEEKKHLRKSLKTRDFETAVKRAEELVFKTFSDVRYEGDRYVAFTKWWNAKLANGETKGAFLFAEPLTAM